MSKIKHALELYSFQAPEKIPGVLSQAAAMRYSVPPLISRSVSGSVPSIWLCDNAIPYFSSVREDSGAKHYDPGKSSLVFDTN